MMNEMKYGRSTLLALVLLCLSLIVFPSSQASGAPGRASCIIDEVRVLSLADVKLLQPKLTAIEDAHHIRILAVTVKDWKGRPLEPLARQILSGDLAAGGENGAILLLLSPENKTYCVGADEKIRARISDEGIEHLKEDFLPAHNEFRYADTFTVFVAGVDEMLTYYEKEGKPFTAGGALSAVARAVADGTPASDGSGLGAVRVIDESDLITEAEEQALDAKLAAYEQAHGIRILVGTVKNTHGQVLGKVANAVVDRIESGGENGTIVLLLAPKERDFYISTDNKMRQRITDEYGIEYLADSFVPDLKDNEYGKAYTAFAATVDEMLTYYEKEGKPYIPLDPWAIVGILGTALLLAAVVHHAISSYLEEGMDTTAHASEADDYLSYSSVRITHSKDIYIRTSEARRAKYEPKTSSSGSHITTSSSDSSHGGGGGKY